MKNCCDGDCRQGRDCPHRVWIDDLEDMVWRIKVTLGVAVALALAGYLIGRWL